jgi:hypothetical protein
MSISLWATDGYTTKPLGLHGDKKLMRGVKPLPGYEYLMGWCGPSPERYSWLTY